MSTPDVLNTKMDLAVVGKHVIIECKGQHATLSEYDLRTLMINAASEGGATVVGCHFHTFGIQQGVTGVVLLAESHITVHTWPESLYAAFDIFMCGRCDPQAAAEVICNKFPNDLTNMHSLDRSAPPESSHLRLKHT